MSAERFLELARTVPVTPDVPSTYVFLAKSAIPRLVECIRDLETELDDLRNQPTATDGWAFEKGEER